MKSSALPPWSRALTQSLTLLAAMILSMATHGSVPAHAASPDHASQVHGPLTQSQQEELDETEEEQDSDFETRLSHARELMGRFYSRSVVRAGEKLENVERFVRRQIRRELPKKFRKQSSTIADAILEASREHELDPIFVMAVIRNESAFDPLARGTSGEIGLMQLMPATAKEVARKLKIRWRGAKTLENPRNNIRIGTAYMAYLREELDAHGRLYLSAYNMGMGNLKSALEREIWPKDYVRKVMRLYVAYYRGLRDKGSI